jgi:hypothetical protein
MSHSARIRKRQARETKSAEHLRVGHKRVDVTRMLDLPGMEGISCILHEEEIEPAQIGS